MNKNKQLLDSSKTNNCGMTEQNHLNSVSIENASLQRGLWSKQPQPGINLQTSLVLHVNAWSFQRSSCTHQPFWCRCVIIIYYIYHGNKFICSEKPTIDATHMTKNKMIQAFYQLSLLKFFQLRLVLIISLLFFRSLDIIKIPISKRHSRTINL